MKCFAITAQGTHCSREVVSGNTLALDGRIVRLCNQHYKTVVNISQVWTSEPKFINNVQEDTITMNIDKDFDDKHSFKAAVAKMENNPYRWMKTAYAGTFVLEDCKHDACNQYYMETIWEGQGEVCCGESNCKHCYPLVCLEHVPSPTLLCLSCIELIKREDFDLENGACKECIAEEIKSNNTSKEDTMNTIIIPTAGPEMDDLNAPFMTAGEIRLSNEIKENNMPNSPVTGSSDRGDKWIKCVKCSKEIGSDWYHANVADMRTCMGAAPAPVKAKPSVRGGFDVDIMSGTSVRGDYTWFFDSSFEVVKAKSIALKAAGLNPFAMKKSSRGDWYVAFRTVTES